MTTPPLRPRGALLAMACALLAACAGGPTPGPAPVTPADISTLEAEFAGHPGDAAAGLRLARAYYAAHRYADARRVVGQAPSDEGRAYLGLSYEGLEQFDSARAVYTSLLAAKTDRRVRRLLAGRLALLTRKELQSYARVAIARESLLARTPPDPNTVAVMPFRYTGGDSSLRPLERGLAALMITDLARVRRLRLVERERIQVLLDEIQMTAGGRVDASTGARSGRLVGAGQVVQGQFSEVPNANIRVDASVVRVSDAQVAATGSGADQMRALFDIEKQVVFQLLDRLRITLTPAERSSISERPTRDIQAFLLYSRGLEAQDRGDFAGATRAFQAAAQRDPGFSAATQGAQQSQATQAADAAPATDVATGLGGAGPPTSPPMQGTLGDAINRAVPSGAGLIPTTSTTTSLGGINPNTLPTPDPNRLCEGASCDGPARATLFGGFIIIIKRP